MLLRNFRAIALFCLVFLLQLLCRCFPCVRCASAVTAPAPECRGAVEVGAAAGMQRTLYKGCYDSLSTSAA